MTIKIKNEYHGFLDDKGEGVNNLTIAKKLALAFGGTILLMVILLGISMFGQSRTAAREATLRILIENTRVNADSLIQANLSSQEIISQLLLALGDRSQMNVLKARLEEIKKAEDPLIQALGKDLEGEESVNLYELSKNKLKAYREEQEAFVDAVMDSEKKDQDDLSRYYFTGVVPSYDFFSKALGDFTDHQKSLANILEAQTNVELARLRIIQLSLTAIAVVLSIFAAWYVTKSIAVPLNQAVAIAGAIAEGKLDNIINARGRDETAVLLKSLFRMQSKLADHIGSMTSMVAENVIVRESLKSMDTMVAIVNLQGQVQFANPVLERFIASVASRIKASKADFDPATWTSGGTVAVLYDQKHSPAEIVQSLIDLHQPQKSQRKILGRVFDCVECPIIDSHQQRMGTVIQLSDVTGQIATEQELIEIVDDAAQGNFNRQLSIDGKSGWLANLSLGVNRLLESTASNLGEISHVFGAISHGDLTKNISGDFQGAFGKLRDDSNRTIEQLANIVRRVKDVAITVNVATGEIASGNQDLAKRTELHAASIEQTASSIDILMSTVRQNADSARQANQLALGASEVASKGGKVVNAVVTTMNSIDQASRRIFDIIAVIDGIAFQTNILALNAAVEAARAGDQGRGFAVVASEVRSLAQRSADAAKEIKGLIEDSVGRVSEGTTLVRQAGQTMEDVVSSITRVTDIVAEMAAAGEEQRNGIESVCNAISKMDEGTQQNAALVEQAAASAYSLLEQSKRLVELVSTFDVGNTAILSKATASEIATDKSKCGKDIVNDEFVAVSAGTQSTQRPSARAVKSAEVQRSVSASRSGESKVSAIGIKVSSVTNGAAVHRSTPVGTAKKPHDRESAHSEQWDEF